MTLELDVTVASDGTATDVGRAGRVAAAAAFGAGAMLAHFRIEGLLGAGGMGEVYRATDLALDRPVALKVLPAAIAQDPVRRERLLREARSQARLQHPNVCHIYYVGQQDGVVFFAMELVAGETLAERLARGPVPADQAIELIRQAALGLREAQRHNFTHRDIKPSNLICDREGRVKVLDFGLVKVGPGNDPGGVAGDLAAGSSDTTGLVGTPLYMAPEQAGGEAMDLRADIYALGATLHHLVSGRPPFEGDTFGALATQHRSGSRPRLVAAGRLGRALTVVDAVVARMMAKRPDDRFASYDELVAELERISPARTRPAGWWVRAMAALIDLMVVVLVMLPLPITVGSDGDTVDGNLVFGLVVPLYHVIGLSRWGTTIGRWLLDLEVTTVTGQGRPSLGAATLRYLAEYGPVAGAILLSSIGVLLGTTSLRIPTAILGIGGMIWGLLELTRAALRTPDKRTAWDRVAGTMVRYRVRKAPD